MGIINIFEKLFAKVLIKIIFLSLILVLLSQTIIYYQPYNLKLSLVDRLEGEPIRLAEIQQAGNVDLAGQNITLKVLNTNIKSLPEAKILLNDMEIGDFSNMQFSFLAKKGDLITIDASRYSLDLRIHIIPSEEMKIKDGIINVKKGEKAVIAIEN
ncbi:MAG: hypothetical protein GXW85_11075 [Clostridia bacterium]|nr:hypothetical protein [Clostridia bacterium]